METDSPVVYHGTTESRFSPEQSKRTKIQLTQEEIRVLRECNKESFYYRCLPLALAGMTAAFLAVRNGYLKGSPRWGPAGKMTGACIIGWIIGKVSYRNQCEDKFLKLENSVLADAIRKRRGYITETFNRQEDEDLSSFGENRPRPSSGGDYHSSSGSLNLDVDKNISYSGLDDRDRPTTDRESYSEKEPILRTVTYEELRRRNREGLNPTSKQWPPKEDSLLNDARQKTGTKNIYGDSWDNPKFT